MEGLVQSVVGVEWAPAGTTMVIWLATPPAVSERTHETRVKHKGHICLLTTDLTPLTHLSGMFSKSEGKKRTKPLLVITNLVS